MPNSPDLLRDAEVLRKLLTECLRRVDRLERRLIVEALDHDDEPTAPPLTDPFEQVLPHDDRGVDARDASTRARTTPSTDDRSTIRTLHLAPGSRLEPDELLGPHAGPKTPRSPEARPSPNPNAGAPPPSGDGTLDPFALLDVSAPPPEPIDAEIRRGMNALLGGLDVSTPGDE